VKIAQVAPLYESVPPQGYGGTERIVSYLTEELVRMGHDVTLFASGDSKTRAQLRAACPRSLRLDPNSTDALAPHVRLVERVSRSAEEFDIIHFHIDYLHFPLSRRLGYQQLTTLHGRLDLPELIPLYRDFREMPLVSISDSQRGPLSRAHWLATVHHGIPKDLYEFHEKPGSTLAFLGRVSPEKGCDQAIEIARQAGMTLRIAAKVDLADREFFDQVIRPRLKEPGIEFLGEIGEKEKRTLLGEARALLFPIQWPEPFGLVMIESLACGTPVVACGRGSVSEIIRNGITGFVARTPGELVPLLGSVDRLDRGACRRDFESRFTVTRMAEDYVQVYLHLLEEAETWRR
jgi:glycosyltransferase involved in cell wall biosynthesis